MNFFNQFFSVTDWYKFFRYFLSLICLYRVSINWLVFFNLVQTNSYWLLYPLPVQQICSILIDSMASVGLWIGARWGYTIWVISFVFDCYLTTNNYKNINWTLNLIFLVSFVSFLFHLYKINVKKQ